MKIRSFVGFALLPIPIILVISWHLCNRSLPGGDAADFAEASLHIARQFHDQGTGAGLAALLNMRGWKPTIFPVLAAPGFLLTDSHLVAGPAATLILIYVALVAYLYRLALLLTKDPLVAAATCTAVLTMPAIATYSLIFFSESAWILFSVACVYHLLRSDSFVNTGQSAMAGTFGGLMITARPVESVIVLGVLLSFLMVRAIRSKTLTVWSSLIVVGVFSVPAGLLLLSTWAKGISRFHIWGVCLLALGLGVFLAKRLGWQLIAFFGALISVSCFWWGGFMPMLYVWARLAFEDNMRARITSMGSASEMAEALLKLARELGGLQLVLLACLALFLIASAIKGMRSGRNTDTHRPRAVPAQLVLYAATILLGILAATYSAEGSDRRRGLVAFVWFATPVIAIAASRSRLALGLVLGLAAVQCTNLACTTAQVASPRWASLSINTSGLPWSGPFDQNSDAAQILARYVTTGSNVAVYTMALFGGPRVYEPNSLRIICFRDNMGFNANNIDSSGSYDQVVARMRNEHWKYVLLDSLQEFVPTAVREPHVHFTRELQQRLRAGNTPGLRVLGRFLMGDREHTIFRVLPETAPPSSVNNLASDWYGSRAITTSQQRGFLIANLNDGSELAWGSKDGKSDLYAAIVLPAPHAVREMRLHLFSPEGRPHMRDIRIVAADVEGPSGPDWKFVRARVKDSDPFSNVITVPPLPDNSVVTIEIDMKDPEAHARPIWGFACLRSQGDVPNYLGGQAVYLRDLEMQ